MADTIGIVVAGDRKVALRFEEFPHHLHDKLLSRITQMKDQLEGRVKAAAPQGATGELRDSVYGKVFDDRTRITGFVAVGEDFAKAGALEWGAHNTIQVRGHRARLDHNWGEKLARPISVFVEAHRRTLSLKPVRYLREPLATSAPQFTAELQETVAETAAEGEA